MEETDVLKINGDDDDDDFSEILLHFNSVDEEMCVAAEASEFAIWTETRICPISKSIKLEFSDINILISTGR